LPARRGYGDGCTPDFLRHFLDHHRLQLVNAAIETSDCRRTMACKPSEWSACAADVLHHWMAEV